MDPFVHFAEIWVEDWEFLARPGERPEPHCCVARELRSGRLVRRWITRLPNGQAGDPPYDMRENSLLLSYFGTAEIGCRSVVSWPLPRNHIDLYVEFGRLTCGKVLPAGRGLLGALKYFGREGMAVDEKEAMRGLSIRGGPFTDQERCALLDYCEADVNATASLFEAMRNHIDWARALIRGRFVNVAAQIEANGIPIDTVTLRQIQARWPVIKEQLIARVDRDYGVYDGNSFRHGRFAAWLEREGISWPRLPSGQLKLDEDTFRDLAKFYPQVIPLKELRRLTRQLNFFDLPVGTDGRNRTMVAPFASRTGRNQPKASEFIFGAPEWTRALIQPSRGRACAYLDFEQQEFAIAAALSRDERMMDAYRSGDAYLTSAKQVGAVPPDATRESHAAERGKFKTVTIATQYGMGVQTLSARLNCGVAEASELLALHRRTFPRYWQWSDGVQDWAMMTGELQTSFGWRVLVDDKTKPCFVRNFLLQANGAEMLRLACIFATEKGVALCAPVHDALLIEADEGEIGEASARCEAAMRQASEAVLNGFPLRNETKTFGFPDRFPGAEDSQIYQELKRLLAESENDEPTVASGNKWNSVEVQSVPMLAA